jgi:VCBS repeat-containing protein
MNFRLYYSNYTTEEQDAGNLPGLASPPNIARVIGTPNGSSVDVEALVVGNPGAGIQEVWVTFTGESGGLHGAWQSADMEQDINDSRMWRGSFDVSGTPMEDVRFIVQACSGTGLCSLVDNVGNYFIPGADGDTVPTALTQPLSSGAFYDAVDGIDYQKVGDEVTFTATLTADFPAADVSNRPVFFGLGPESRLGITDENGTAEVTFLLVSAPGDYEVTAWFPGNANLAASTSPVLPFRITQQTTTLILEGPSEPVAIGVPLPVTAMLEDGGSPPTLPLAEQAVLFAVFDGTLAECPVDDEAAAAAGASAYKTVFTGLLGEAPLGEMDLSSGDYTVCAYFRETPSYTGSADQLLLTINSAPVANDDSYAVNYGETLDVATPGVLANDSDVDGNALSAAVVDEPTNGTLNLNADGSFTYEITNSSAVGDSFTYQACDVPYGACDQATVTITINQPPVCEQVIALTDQGDYPTLWPTNKRETFIYLSGATDLEDDASNIALEYFFLDIMQDEETGDTYDAEILNSCTDSWVRSQRDGTGDGRVYEISYLVRDSAGAYCQGTVDIATLPHDQSGDTTAIKGDTLYSSGPLATCPLVLP